MGFPMVNLIPHSSQHYLGLVAVCVIIAFAAGEFLKSPDMKVATPKPTVVSSSTPVSVHVLDGDTISLGDGRPNVRLVGFNTPETGSRARCETERQKGIAAQQRLRKLVSTGRSDFTQVACSCPAGTEGTSACNFGRRCGTLRIDGVDVGSTLIDEGLAVRFICGATSCPVLPRPWC